MSSRRSDGASSELAKLWALDLIVLVCLIADAANAAGCVDGRSAICIVVNGFSPFVTLGWLGFAGLTIVASILTLMLITRGSARRR